MKRIYLALLFCMVSLPVYAQERILVRAAEHPEYSRLIISLSSDSTWVISSEGRKTLVTFTGQRMDFEMGNIFARMPRTRIVGVVDKDTPLGSALELTLNCSCVVEATRVGSRYLAIDVKRAEAGAHEKVARRLLNSHAKEPVNTHEIEANDDPQMHHTDADVAPLQDEAEAKPDHMQADALDMHADQMPPEVTEESAHSEALSIMRDELTSQLSHAAQEGLLDLVEVPEHHDPDQTMDKEHAQNGEDLLLKDRDMTRLLLEGALDNAQITTRSPLDRESSGSKAEAKVHVCTNDTSLNVARWSSDEPVMDQIGTLRRALISDYGNVDDKAVGALARFYILNGFGREASSVLDMARTEFRDKALLSDLALVVEGREVPDTGALSVSDNCEGRVSMWRAVAGLEPLDPDTAHGEVILNAFSELPPELRRIAGQGIAERAIHTGEQAAAEEVIRILDRTPGPRNIHEQYLRADLSVRTGFSHRTDKMIAELEQGSNAETQRGLLLRARAVLENDQHVPDSLINDLEIEQRLVRGSSEGLEISKSLAKLFAQRGEQFAAMATLREAKIDHPSEVASLQHVGRKVLDDLDIAHVEAGDYVRLVLENSDFLTNDKESVALRRKFAQTFREQGLANAALALLDTSGALETSEIRLLRAQVYLDLDEPENTLETLTGLTQSHASRLRADAHVKQGSLDQAFHSIASLSNDDADRSKLALLSGNLSEMNQSSLEQKMLPFAQNLNKAAEGTQPPTGGAASALNASNQQVTDSDLTLGALRAQLDSASAFRTAVDLAISSE